MEEVKEENQIKPEVEEECTLLQLEDEFNKYREDVKNINSTFKEEEEELVAAKEENPPVNIDCKEVVTSLVRIKDEYHAKNLAHVSGRPNADSEEKVEDLVEEGESHEVSGELQEGNMDDEKISCIVSFESRESSIEQMNDSNSIDEQPPMHQCSANVETFEYKEGLIELVEKGNEKVTCSKFCCKTCGMEFKYKANCRKHEKLHSDVFRFKCKYCHISFKQSLTLKNHYIYVHETEKPYKCDECMSSFKSLNNLKSHIEVHHNLTGETFPCDFCHMEFRRKCYLKRHILTHTNPDKKFTCADCGLKCRSKTDIAKHVLTHIGIVEKRFFCELCGSGFSKHAHLVRHSRTHSVEKSFPCVLCDRAYKDQYSLKTHHETVHLGITFSCEICGFQSDRHSIKKHLKRCERQKKYTCEVCNKEYFLKKWFEVHISKCRAKS